MSIEIGLRNTLKNDSTVGGLVATSDSPPAHRIYPLKLPQGYVLPAISYQRVSASRRHTLPDGPTGWAWARFQFDCWAVDYSGVRSLANAVRQALDGFSGDMDGTHVGGIYVAAEREMFEEDAEIYRVVLDFSVPHEENT